MVEEGRLSQPGLGCVEGAASTDFQRHAGDVSLHALSTRQAQKPMNRPEILNRLSTKPDLEVLIIGGGINGIGTFRELALNGVDVFLVERADFCSGASAASSHMAHGGLRYLENGEFRLVREAVKERNRLLRNAPHLVKPLSTTVPLFRWMSGLLNAPLKFLQLLDRPAERGALVVKLGLLMYDALSGSKSPVPRHSFRSRRSSLARWPRLNPRVLGTASYYDGIILSPERLTLELLLDAERARPEVGGLNYVRYLGANGEVVQLRDELSRREFEVRPKILVNASGPWIDVCNASLGAKTRLIGGTKGSHVVLDHPALREAIGEDEFFFENRDGRIVLILPLANRVLVGTSDLPIQDADEARCSEEEVDYFFEAVGRVFPGIRLGRDQIVFRYSGVRPLAYEGGKPAGQITRDHSIRLIEKGSGRAFPVYSLVGGKWTTFRALSAQTADQVLAALGMQRRVETDELPIGGGRNYQSLSTTDFELRKMAARCGLASERMLALYNRYGSRATEVGDYLRLSSDRPLRSAQAYSTAELAFLGQHEKVVHLDDLLLRRTLIGVLGQLTTEVLEETSAVLGDTLGWSRQARANELQRTRALLADRNGVVL